MKRALSGRGGDGLCGTLPAAGCRFTVTAIRPGVFGDKTRRADVEDTAAANWTPGGRKIRRGVWESKGGMEKDAAGGRLGEMWREREIRRERKIGRGKDRGR